MSVFCMVQFGVLTVNAYHTVNEPLEGERKKYIGKIKKYPWLLMIQAQDRLD